MEDFVLSIPSTDRALMDALVIRMGWKMRPRRHSVEAFIGSCPDTPQMTDEEIMKEVNAVRYSL